ncbi:hypothetical protein C8R43DRAFT_944250 [Mycena crocata]|nr:hypothetical protein C8R43DRAFT_944250 [Mycena crocata]
MGFQKLALVSALLSVRVLAAKLDESTFKLTLSGYNSNIAKLDAILPIVSVSKLLADTNHANPAVTVSASNFLRAYTWADETGYDDVNTESWYPQGVTTSADALDTGIYQDKKVILVDWQGSSDFVHRPDLFFREIPECAACHPFADANGNPSFRAVPVHGGGIMWYGNNLYVVDTNHGIRVFDMDHIYQVSTGDGIGRISSTNYQAFNYKYVIPQSLTYTAATLPTPMRWSFISLDRTTTPNSIVVGEYAVDDTHQCRDGHLGLPSRYSTGVTSINGKFFISRSNGAGTKADLYTWVPGGSATEHTGAFPPGAEDLSYNHNADELWTLTEHPGKRYIVAVKASAF